MVRCALPTRDPGLAADDPGPMPGTSAQATAAAYRQRWAVELMNVTPQDRLLEIGCGRGVAASLVASRLGTGRIVAIDRAATMARLATERNAHHINSGTAEIRCAEFESVDVPNRYFTKIYAVNVNLFWLDAAAQQIDRMRSLLAAGGRLYVFGERPMSVHPTANLTSTERLLRAQGFATTAVTEVRGQGRVLTCVTARPTP
ncbi:methyltransferase domain-containing protein [Plantactinospora sp. S1510]|uniref:Methyltransferase domain-containing protein n=1 Tax=Plantactinospora alkalitolerans TaxID=2789879 RepID=A0ABS0GXA6_9ACTN|nr:methyltransferase domain-containing protein [Plantactinospora alkalitolerans]MBF9130840.1 methyltransferase domain-containing protein [Plantactinospora alkalitolerans]